MQSLLLYRSSIRLLILGPLATVFMKPVSFGFVGPAVLYGSSRKHISGIHVACLDLKAWTESADLQTCERSVDRSAPKRAYEQARTWGLFVYWLVA